MYITNFLKSVSRVGVAVAAIATGGQVHAADFAVRRVSHGIAHPTDPVVYDLDADGAYECIIGGSGGIIAAYRLDTLEPIWNRQISDNGLTGPAIGDFLGTGAPVVAVASSKGTIHFLTPADGAELAKIKIADALSVEPTVVPLEKRVGFVADGIAIPDDSGTIHLISIRDGNPVEEFSVPNAITETGVAEGQSSAFNVGRFSRPLSTGDIDGDGVPEILAGSVSGTVQAVPINDPAKRVWWRAPQGTNIATNVAAADFFKSGADNMVFGTAAGEVYVLSFDKGRSAMTVSQKQRLLGAAHGHLLTADLDSDGYPDLIGASNATVASFDGAAQMSNFQGQNPFATHSTPISFPAVYSESDGKLKLIVGDQSGTINILDPTLVAEGRKVRVSLNLTELTPAGNLTGNGKLSIVTLGDQGSKLVVIDTDEAAAGSSPPTLTYGGNFQRDGDVGARHGARAAAARQRADDAFDALIAKADAALSAGNRAEADTATREALRYRIRDPRVEALSSKTVGRFNWLKNLILGVVVLGVSGGVATIAWRVFARKRRYAVAAGHAEAGRSQEAARAYQEIVKGGDQSPAILAALADSIIQSGEIGPESVEALRAAHKANPDRDDLIPALANALSEAGDSSPEALDAYQIALATMESGRGRIAYQAAVILQERGDLDQAQKYYRTALRDGFDLRDIHERLAQIALQTRQFTEKSLPHLEVVAEDHFSDAEFVEGLARAFAAARRLDPRAREAYQRLLELKPDSALALRQLAKCEITAGNYEEASHFARKALDLTPKDMETVGLLAQCHVALGTNDENAITILKQALEGNPNQADLQRSLGTALLGRGVRDDDEYKILKQAAVSNSKDENLLLGLAREATNRGEVKTVIKCLERARALGVDDATLTVRLAKAYAEAGVIAPETEAVYREALRSHPDDPALLKHHALALAQQGLTDASSMITLEKAFQGAGSDPNIGRQLAKAYLQNERYDDAVKLVRWLLQHDKDDAELQKLFADASLRSNRIDEAIRQFEQFHKLHPEDTEATVKLAIAYAEKQSTDTQAAAIYEEALKLQPDQPSVRIQLGRHHASQGRVARGLEEFRQAMTSDARTEARVVEETRALIAEHPERPDLRWFLTNLLIDRNRLTEALEQLEEIFEADPDQVKPVLQALDRVLAKDSGNFQGNLLKGMLLKVQGRFEDARPYLERAHKANPTNAEAGRELAELYETMLKERDDIQLAFDLGRLCYTMKEYDSAIGHFQKTMQDFRYENESIKHLGLCFVEKGMLEFALQEFRKLVIDEELKGILYDLARRYEAKNDIVGAKQVYRMLFAADINYKDVKVKFEQLAGSTSDPLTLDRTELLTQLGEKAQRRYELIEELGRGAMGIVYKAKDKELEEVVALKILPDNLSQSPEAIQRFRAEARSARRLAHPNIVRIHDIGEELGRKFISMEFVSGTDLKKHLRSNGPLPVEAAVDVMRQIAQALDYAHSLNIVHRDIKPANMMLTDKMVVKVSDFGIAKMLESTSETLAGAVIGTPLYMSPEQVQGHPVDNGADIYSLGVMMYELVTGRPPFSSGDLAYQHVNVKPEPPKDVPEALANIIMKCLEKQRADRYATAGQIVRALDEAFGQDLTAGP